MLQVNTVTIHLRVDQSNERIDDFGDDITAMKNSKRNYYFLLDIRIN